MRVLVLISLFAASTALANAGGVVGYSGKPPAADCNGCHSGGTAPAVSFSGPTTLTAGQTATYTFTVSAGSYGVNIAAEPAQAALNPVSSTVTVAFGEITHKSRLSGGTVQFSLTAPPFAGTVKLYGTGNAVNGDGNTGGDRSASTTFDVTVSSGSGANAPAIISPASLISPDGGVAVNPVNGASTGVAVTAADDGPGEPGLSYTWSATGPAAVAFSPNGSNSAKASTATFSTDGSYVLTVTIRDGLNNATTSTLNVTVSPAYTFLRMVPVTVSVPAGGTQVFTATQRDQFDRLLPTQAKVTYLVPFGGTISSDGGTTGTFKAQNGPGGPFVVQSSAASKATSSSVQVGGAAPMAADTTPPNVSIALPSVPLTPLSPATVLEAVASDDTGVAEVAFEVAQIRIGVVTNGPPWKMNFVQVAGLPGGVQSLEAVAKDIAGNVTRSASLPVTVTASPPTDGGGTGGGSGGSGGGSGGSGGTGGAGGAGGCSCGTTTGTPVAVVLALLALALWRRPARERVRSRRR